MVRPSNGSNPSQGPAGDDLDAGEPGDADVRLSEAAFEYWISHPEVSRQDALKWARRTADHRDVEPGDLPARGPDGDVLANIRRSERNAERQRDLADQGD